MFGEKCLFLQILFDLRSEVWPHQHSFGGMKVLFLCDGLAPFVIGGMQQHSTMLVKHLAPLVDHITLMHCGHFNEAPPSNEEVFEVLGNPKNVCVKGVVFRDKGILPGHYLRASKRLSRQYLENVENLSSYSCIYAQGFTGNAFLHRHNRVLVNLHGLNMFQTGFSWRDRFSKALMRPLSRKQIRNAWKSVSLGGDLTKLLLGQGATDKSIAVIPNGIAQTMILDPEQRRQKRAAQESRKIRFVMVGRNDFAKGLHVLQEALSQLTVPIELHLIGNWPEWDAGRHHVVYHGLVHDRNIFLSILDTCDVLLLPSLSEGMPTVILEALARDLDVIASEVGAVSEILGQESLVPPGDSKALADRIGLRNFDKTRIQTNLEHYCWDQVARKTVKVFLNS